MNVTVTTISQYAVLYDSEHEAYKKRYKVFYGGRYSAKSTQVARALLVRGTQRKLTILCTREIQKSITDSVKRLLDNQIELLSLNSFYRSTDTKITGLNGTEFLFQGLQQHTVTSVKSFEGTDLCWVEEASTVSRQSWEVLIPTIRKENSEIWITFNPDVESDYVYSQFVMRKRDDAYVCKVNYSDLPVSWLTNAIKSEIEALKRDDYDSYLHIYGGECRKVSDELIIQPALLRRAFDAEVCAVYPDTPLVLGLDPARLGGDKIKLTCRVGRNISYINQYPAARIDETTALLIHDIDKQRPDKVFIDCGGLGVGIYDNCVGLGYKDVVAKIDFGGRSYNPDRYDNKRAEMYEAFAYWLADSPCSIKCDKKTQDELILQATAVKKVWKKNSVLGLTAKDEIKKQYGFSPDDLDSIVLTFAQRVNKRKQKNNNNHQQQSSQYTSWMCA